MKRPFWILAFGILTFWGIFFSLGFSASAEDIATPLVPEHPQRLPKSFLNERVAPELGCFWSLRPSMVGQPDALQKYIDVVGKTGAFDNLVLTIRGLDSLDALPEHVETMRKAVEYARDQTGIGALLDIDLRIARQDFERRYPNRLQEKLWLQEKEQGGEPLVFRFAAPNLTDHYTGNYPYYVRGNRFVKAWSYRKNAQDMVISDSVKEISALAQYVSEGVAECAVRFAPEAVEVGNSVCVAVAFSYLYPDLFAEETYEYDRQLYERYRSIPAAGTAKDEWGFPPDFERQWQRNTFWFSESARLAYAKKTGERVLIDDFFLIFRPQTGKDEIRLQAVDHWNRLCFQQVLDYENLHYEMAKKCWGAEAFVGVHGTWYPWPNELEMRKNGLMWWKMKRDYAQTDEYVPFCCRNAMAKATNSLWYNMFYDVQPESYRYEHWTDALSAGRVHIHQIYPARPNGPSTPENYGMLPILEEGTGRIRSRIRLLNLVSNAPIESTVAVVFGHFGSMNYLRPEYQKTGVSICDAFAVKGYPADLIPSDEITTQGLDGTLRWKKNADGYLQYGVQPYRIVVLYGENDSDRNDMNALRTLAGTDCKTQIVSIPVSTSSKKVQETITSLIAGLQANGVPGHSLWEPDRYRFMPNNPECSVRPPLRGFARLVDGTLIWTSAEQCGTGDVLEIQNETIRDNRGNVRGTISAKAVGVLACRVDDAGNLVALAASELSSFQCGTWNVTLQTPTDVVLVKDSDGHWTGVFQAKTNVLPEELKPLAERWYFLELPSTP